MLLLLVIYLTAKGLLCPRRATETINVALLLIPLELKVQRYIGICKNIIRNLA